MTRRNAVCAAPLVSDYNRLMATKAALKIRYDACFWRDPATKLVVASARPLDVVSAGKDEQEARKNLDEALQLFFETTIYMGTLDVILEESGYQMIDGVWEPPAVATSRETVEVSA